MILIILFFMVPIFAKQTPCTLQISGYKIAKYSVFPFSVDKEKACFFAFYTKNPDPGVDTKGAGNRGDSLWYGYYLIKKPNRIYKFPKPPEDDYWSRVCSLEAVSFIDMDGDNVRDVTVIGSCNKQNAIHYTFPFVFLRKNGKYVLEMEVYDRLMWKIGLTVSDLRAYIKSPGDCYGYLDSRSDMNATGKMTCD